MPSHAIWVANEATYFAVGGKANGRPLGLWSSMPVTCGSLCWLAMRSGMAHA